MKVLSLDFLKNLLPWQDITLLHNALSESGGDARLIGGCVRDILLGKAPCDVDIATSLSPEKVGEVLVKKGVKVIPTGLSHGTVTAILNHRPYEITTLRKDVKCYGRKAEVEFTDDWKEDAKRRDFTCNALSIDINGCLYDYFGGAQDLENRVVKFIGSPRERIFEDYLRILRYFRFCAYLGVDNLDQESFGAAVKYSGLLTRLAVERIKNEIFKLLACDHAINVIPMMIEHGIFKAINVPFKLTPEFDAIRFSDNPLLNFAAICILSNLGLDTVRDIANYLKFSNKEKSQLMHLCFPKIDVDLMAEEKVHKRWIYRLGKENYRMLIELKKIMHPKAEVSRLLELVEKWELPKFPLNGHVLKTIVRRHKDIGHYIALGQRYWIENDFKPLQPEIIEYIKDNSLR